MYETLNRRTLVALAPLHEKTSPFVSSDADEEIPMKRTIIPVLMLLATTATAKAQTSKAEYVYPLIKGYGGVVKLADAAQTPRANSKVVIDININAQLEGYAYLPFH